MRRFLLIACLLLVPVASVRTEDKAKTEEKVKIDDDTQKSIDKALEWLKDNQEKEGGWGRNTAVTSFALLAYLSQGHLPTSGKYAPEVSKAIRNLLAGAREDGYLVGPTGGNMYAHGMAALALTQVWGMTGDEEVKKVLKKSINLIVESQNSEGGWRYEPKPTGADISVTIMMVMALRGAKDSGLHVPKETMDKAFQVHEELLRQPYRRLPLSARWWPRRLRPAPLPVCVCSNSVATTKPRRLPGPSSTWTAPRTTAATTGTATTTPPMPTTRSVASSGRRTTAA